MKFGVRERLDKGKDLEDYRLAPAYDLVNTGLHVFGDDFGLEGGLSMNMFRSDVYDKTGHPCRKDFERFGERIGLRPKRIEKLLDRYSVLPQLTEVFVSRFARSSALNWKKQETQYGPVKQHPSACGINGK